MAGGMQSLRVLLCVLATMFAMPGFAQGSEFPLDSNLFLDARPMPGSKRIPNLEVRPDHSIVLELWCNRADGQVIVAGDTITIMVGQPTDRQCRPNQTQRDADLLAALAEHARVSLELPAYAGSVRSEVNDHQGAA